jgi:hypothetical protein
MEKRILSREWVSRHRSSFNNSLDLELKALKNYFMLLWNIPIF